MSSCLSLSLRSVESVSDGLFHTVELLIQNHSLSLVVDKGSPKSLGKLPRQPSVDHNTQLYIGGKQKPISYTHLYTPLPYVKNKIKHPYAYLLILRIHIFLVCIYISQNVRTSNQNVRMI